MLVGRKVTQDSGIRSIKRNDAWRAADRAAGTVTNAVGLQYAFFPSSFAVARDPWFHEADLVQLHNLHGSYFGFTAPRLTRRRPTVWLSGSVVDDRSRRLLARLRTVAARVRLVSLPRRPPTARRALAT